MRNLVWILRQLLNQTPHSIATDLGITQHDIFYIIEHNPRVSHELYTRTRQLIRRHLRFLPDKLPHQHRYKQYVTQEIETLLTPQPKPSHHTKYENITAQPYRCTRHSA